MTGKIFLDDDLQGLKMAFRNFYNIKSMFFVVNINFENFEIEVNFSNDENFLKIKDIEHKLIENFNNTKNINVRHQEANIRCSKTSYSINISNYVTLEELEKIKLEHEWFPNLENFQYKIEEYIIGDL